MTWPGLAWSDSAEGLDSAARTLAIRDVFLDEEKRLYYVRRTMCEWVLLPSVLLAMPLPMGPHPVPWTRYGAQGGGRERC